MVSQHSQAERLTSSPTIYERPEPGDLFWTAYARGANFEELERLGFLVFYPVVDDYVFLRAIPENRGLVERSDALGLPQGFLRSGGQLAEVTWQELAGLAALAVQSIFPGDPVEVVRGTAEGLRGRVLARDAEGVRVRVQGWRRTYELTVEGTDLVKVKPDPA